MKKLVYFMLCLLFVSFLFACGNTLSTSDFPDVPGGNTDPSEDSGGQSTTGDEGEYGKVDDSGDHIDLIHYLSFEVEGIELVKIPVMPTDTYESLKPYFPTIPAKENYTGYWEILDSVYSDEQLIITVCAYYQKNNS